MNTYIHVYICVFVHVQSIDNSSLTLTRQMFAYRSSSFQLMRSPSSPPNQTKERRCDSEYDFALLLLRKKKRQNNNTTAENNTRVYNAYVYNIYTCVYTNWRTYVYFCKCVSLCVSLYVCCVVPHTRTHTHPYTYCRWFWPDTECIIIVCTHTCERIYILLIHTHSCIYVDLCDIRKSWKI